MSAPDQHTILVSFCNQISYGSATLSCMERRRFEHLVVELSVAVGKLIPRYALWLLLQELGFDPILLSPNQVIKFYDAHLEQFLAEHGLSLEPREARKLRGRLTKFDPRYPTPYETMERLLAPSS